MSQPNPFPCGGPNMPACPPVPAAGTAYTLDEMKAYGQACYDKGRSDERGKKLLEEG